MSAQNKGTLLMIGCTLMWSTSGFLLEFIDWNPMLIAGARSLPALFVVYGYMRWKGMPIQFTRGVVKIAIAMSLTCVIFIVGCKLSTPVNASALQQTSPMFLMLISGVLYHKQFRRSDKVVVCLMLFGMAMFFFERFEPRYVWGNLCAVLTGVTGAMMYIFMGDEVSDETCLSATFISQILSMLICLPFSFSEPVEFTRLSVCMCLLLGVFQMGVAYVLLSLATRSCPPLTCSLLSTMAPMFNALWMWLFFQKKPTPLAFLGIVIILGTIICWNIYKDWDAKRHERSTQ